MKKLILIFLLAFQSVSYALPLEVGYDHYLKPNSGNNYDDAWGISGRVAHPIYGNLEGLVGVSHITDVGFPSTDDSKGSFGELRGYGATYDLRLSMPINERLKGYLTGGLGYYTWDFRENPFLQTNSVTVDVDDSIAYRAGVGVQAKLSESWSANLELGWFDTSIGKSAKDSQGTEWNILDDDHINLRYIQVKAQVSYRF